MKTVVFYIIVLVISSILTGIFFLIAITSEGESQNFWFISSLGVTLCIFLSILGMVFEIKQIATKAMMDGRIKEAGENPNPPEENSRLLELLGLQEEGRVI